MQKKPLNVEIGARIQLSRERAGLTQEQLAEAIDRSPQFISTIERGVAGPSLETVVLLCTTLGTTADWLLLGQQKTPDAASVTAKLSRLSPEQLAQVDGILDHLLRLLDRPLLPG